MNFRNGIDLSLAILIIWCKLVLLKLKFTGNAGELFVNTVFFQFICKKSIRISFMKVICLFLLLLPFVLTFSQNIDSLHLAINKSKSDTQRVRIYNEIAMALRLDSAEQAIFYTNKAMQLASEIGFPFGLARSHTAFADIERARSNYDTAICHYTSALEIFNPLLAANPYDTVLQIKTAGNYLQLGNCFYYKGIYDEAVENLFKSLRISERSGNVKQACLAYNTLGAIYNTRKNYKVALQNYHKVLSMATAIDNKKFVGTALNNIGALHGNMKNYDTAEVYFNKALKFHQQMGNKKGMAFCYNNLGLIYRNRGEYAKSLEILNESLKIRREAGNKFEIATAYVSIGITYNASGRYQKAVETLTKGMNMGRQLNALYIQRQAAEGLSDSYSKLQDYKNAHTFAVLFKILSDSMINTENEKRMIQVQMEYEYNKKKEIADLESQKKEEIAQTLLGRQKLIRNLFVVAFLLMIVVAFVIYRNFVVKKRANTMLEKQKKNILEINEELVQQKEFIEHQNQELEKHRYNLENLVKERTTQLEIAKNKAEESDRLKSAFLANMSHEIRTPMNAIVGFSSLLLENEIDENEKNKYLKQVVNNCNSLLHLIEDIIHISIIEAGQIQINEQNCNIHALLKELYHVFKQRINAETAKTIDLFLENVKINNEFFLLTDPDYLKQILSSLLDNALKFTETGSISFGYELKETAANKYIQFFVKDTGAGMSREQQANLFVHFSKVHESKDKLYRGAGLELSICKNLVELMGGKIWVESDLNKGSRFYFTLPDNTQTTVNETANSKTSPLPAFNLQQKTILIAEDEDGNYQLLSALLSKYKPQILRACNGLEAIETVKKRKSTWF